VSRELPKGAWLVAEETLRQAAKVLVPVFLAEIGDKTMLATAAFSMRARPLAALAVSALAYIAANSLPVLLACKAAEALAFHADALRAAAGVGFAVLGLLLLLRSEGEEQEAETAGGAFSYFLLLTLSEVGDKTQVVTVLSAALTADAALTLSLGTLSYVAANGIGVAAAQLAKRKLPARALRRASAALFLVIGVLCALTAVL